MDYPATDPASSSAPKISDDASLSFWRAFDDLMDFEGWGTPHEVEGDPGGLTVYGIARNRWPEMYERGLPTLEEAQAFYRREFWDAFQLGRLPYPIAFEIFECAVNAGPYWGVYCAQKAFNVMADLRPEEVGDPIKADGVMGPKTGLALNGIPRNRVRVFVKLFNHFQLDRYLKMRKDLQRLFLFGLIKRV